MAQPGLCAIIEKPIEAVRLLRKAAASGLPNYPAFRDDPFFKPLYNHPQFLRLMADLKREWTGYAKEFGKPQMNADGRRWTQMDADGRRWTQIGEEDERAKTYPA